MAMAGARVIKVEPRGGEHLRRRASVGGAALPFAMLDSNKLSATLDLRSERGKDLLREMVRRADGLLENFAPGALDRLRRVARAASCGGRATARAGRHLILFSSLDNPRRHA